MSKESINIDILRKFTNHINQCKKAAQHGKKHIHQANNIGNNLRSVWGCLQRISLWLVQMHKLCKMGLWILLWIEFMLLVQLTIFSLWPAILSLAKDSWLDSFIFMPISAYVLIIYPLQIYRYWLLKLMFCFIYILYEIKMRTLAPCCADSNPIGGVIVRMSDACL